MKRLYVFIFIVICMISCKTESQKCLESQNYLKAFSKGLNADLPPANAFLIFFISLENGEMMQVNNVVLQHIYFNNYKNDFSFEDFVCLLYSNELKIDATILKKYEERCIVFKLDKHIVNYSTTELKKTFCDNTENYWVLKNNLQKNIQMSVLYTFSKNKFYVSFNDPAGNYVINEKI
ncbi:hypothetical protein R1T16_17800 [Flavobacterium sp. DG1-102-2]|uniref:hypothetical protein n=1 Tax=Flavobacterium sp. DG1-102-2 TaxID=3081663 RepID=UPI002948C742|nr:hypothetical protein [Flavobacterium sp. DG1-102-2]MDV6170294.1 hypothetical protein [Flavobacterium sp. DG1-102-2]